MLKETVTILKAAELFDDGIQKLVPRPDNCLNVYDDHLKIEKNIIF